MKKFRVIVMTEADNNIAQEMFEVESVDFANVIYRLKSQEPKINWDFVYCVEVRQLFD